MAYTTIDNPVEYFNTLTWTGDGTSRSLTGVGFSPDFVWVKLRSGTEWHVLNDSIRGATKNLYSNSTSAEITESLISSLNSDGFTVQNDLKVNSSGSTYVGWCWDANGAGVSNTQGSITSTVSANTTAGFSIVTYTGAGGASTVGHGLGVIPRMIILKGRSNARIWVIGHGSLGWTKYMSFDSAAVETNNYWNDTTPTSSVFSVFSSVNVNGSGETYVAYCFAEVKGFSKFGSYTGNGSTDGSFVYTGFKPAFLIIKRTNVSNNWHMYDNKRDTYNVADAVLYPNSSGAEGTDTTADFLSNGFKLRTTINFANGSGDSYIYMAFAENPFVSSKGIPTTAR